MTAVVNVQNAAVVDHNLAALTTAAAVITVADMVVDSAEATVVALAVGGSGSY